jgi:NAD(P)-dependent dehydrogenase (short-subunit alcohol dehydrogenase family)
VCLDVRDLGSVEAMVDAVTREHGGIDILVNNAAVFDMGPFLHISEKSFDLQFSVNVKGLLFTL